MNTALQNEKAIKKAGILCAVGYQGRYSTQFPELKQVIQKQQIGLVSARWIGGFPGVMWWRDKALSGGQLVEQATHLFDTMRYLLGEIKSVYSVAMSGLNPDISGSTIDDCSSTVLTFESGLVGTMMTGCYLSDMASSDVGLQIFGKNMLIDYDWGGNVRYSSNNTVSTKLPIGNPHFAAMQAFVSAVQSEEKSTILCDYSDSIKTLAVTLAANKSIESSLPITIDSLLS